MADNALAILIVDPKQFLIDLLLHQFKESDVQVWGATSAEQGKEVFQSRRPDVLILDAEIAGAFELLEAVRVAEKPCAVLALTSDEDVRTRLQSFGVETILSHDANFSALIRSLQNYVNGTLSVAAEKDTRILVVEGDNEFLKSLSEHLSTGGYSVLTANSGNEALSLLEQNPQIDLLLLDIKIPDIGGLEMLGTIRKKTPHPETIVITAVEDAVIADQARRLGAFDYLVEPAIADAENVIVACLAHAEYQRQSWWKRLVS